MCLLLLELAILSRPAWAEGLSKRRTWALFASCAVLDLGLLTFVLGA
ncbi:MAG: hypothetical protein H6828_03445 [Planctomycetes bacterium]|nr:hypothetical protein [Planctomycetota bacterium]